MKKIQRTLPIEGITITTDELIAGYEDFQLKRKEQKLKNEKIRRKEQNPYRFLEI